MLVNYFTGLVKVTQLDQAVQSCANHLHATFTHISPVLSLAQSQGRL